MKKNPKNIAALVLLTFFLSGIGATSVLPMVITALAHAHPVFITEGQDKIHLILHHPGNHDAHESAENHDHRHDLLDTMMDVSKNNQDAHTDHEIDLPSFKEKISITKERFTDSGTFTSLVRIHASPVSAQPEFIKHRPPAPPVLNPLRASLRTIILII